MIAKEYLSRDIEAVFLAERKAGNPDTCSF